MAPTELPSGTVTLLFTDIEGSTHLLQRLGDAYPAVLDEHRRFLFEAIDRHGGAVVATPGDAVFAVFAAAEGALAASLDGQRALARNRWPAEGAVRVRMGLHTGDVLVRERDYVGLAVHQAARICAAARGGQVVVSDATAGHAGDRLPPDAGLADLGHHRLKDLPEPLRLWQLTHPDLMSDFPRLRSDAAPGNLPRQITTFVGRRDELLNLADALAAGARLITLTGPGGCGKTRLGLEAAAEVVDGFPAGAWLVDLSGVSEPDVVVQEVSAALEVSEEPGRSAETTLREAIGDKRMLVLLDNCEHLVGPCARLADDLLRACGELRLLVTSQEALGVAGEAVLQVPPLPTKEGVELFVDRARGRRPDFGVRPDEAPYLEAICDRLDGIPLAIELAAARVNVLSPAQIAGRLDDQFRLLTGGSRTALPRQQTLRATVDWSFGLLAGDEQDLLRRLAVFTGGWTLDGAEAVNDGPALDNLDRLVARSLVVAKEQDGEARYRLLQTIRTYGLEKLGAAGEISLVRDRHLAWCAELARQAEPELTGPDQAVWLRRLAAETDNFRAALEWAAANGRDEVLLAMAADLWRFWLVRGLWSEGRAWLAKALGHTRGWRTPARGRALTAAGDLATAQGDLDAAEPLLAESRELWEELGDVEGAAQALNHLGSLARARFEPDAARALLTEALDLRRRHGDERGLAVSLRDLGLLAAVERDQDTARARYEEALPLARTVGDKRLVASIAHALALVRFADGDRPGARDLADEGLAISRQLGDRQGIAQLLTVLAGISAADGDAAAGVPMLEEALAIWATLGSRHAVAVTHTTLGTMALEVGDADVAATHLAAGLDATRAAGDEAAMARVAGLAGRAALFAGDLAAARRLLGEAETLARGRQDASELALALYSLGEVERAEGRWAAARARYLESRETAERAGWKRLLWLGLHGLGALACAEGDLDEAERFLREALLLQPRAGRQEGTVDCLDELATVACRRGDRAQLARAARLLALSDGIRERTGPRRSALRERAYLACRNQCWLGLGPEVLEQARRVGAAMTPAEAVA